MVGIATLLSFLVALRLSRADTQPLTVLTKPCPGVPDVDWTESINAYLRRIPNNVTLPDIFASNEIAGGLEVGRNTLSGLGNLWPYKHYHSYCAGNKTFIEVIAFAHDPLAAEMEWKTCGGAYGHIGMKVSSSKLRLVFIALPSADDPTHVELFKIYGDSLEEPWVYVTGAPKGVTTMIRVIGFLLKAHIKEFWAQLLSMDAQFIIRSHPHA
uniref:Putative secreted protein n=1 Tax=Amblyomma triste TaxID=251400 RepID=A0A023G423_AMBTT